MRYELFTVPICSDQLPHPPSPRPGDNCMPVEATVVDSLEDADCFSASQQSARTKCPFSLLLKESPNWDTSFRKRKMRQSVQVDQ